MFSMWILTIVEALMLSICTIDDLSYKRVNIIPISIFTIAGIIIKGSINVHDAIPGIVLILISIIFKNVGIGDGIVIGCLGLLVGLNGILIITFLALAMSSVCGIASLLFSRKNLKSTCPFMPFLLLGYEIFMCRKKYQDGSMTIEMSLLMPGIFAVLLFIIFTCYYLHDRCVIKRTSYMVCSNIIIAENTYSHNIEKLGKDFDELIDGRLLGKWNLSKNIYYDADKVVFKVYGEMQMIGLFSDYLSSVVYSTNQESYAYVINEIKYINEHRD